MKNLTFTAIDFETANDNLHSICQIGIVKFIDGKIDKEVCQLINPMSKFGFMQQNIHNICDKDVADKPTFMDYYPTFCDLVQDQVLVHHQPFDSLVFNSATNVFSLSKPQLQWIDNAKVVRRTWEQFSKSGYGLKNIADFLGIEFNHHDALEDARTTGLIFLEACKQKNYDLKDWLKAIDKPITKNRNSYHQRIKGDILIPELGTVINCNNPFYMKKVVISGTYFTWPDRTELAKILKELGADIDSSVSAKTNILCAGIGVGPSKLGKMNSNISEGKNALILHEADILEIMNHLNETVNLQEKQL